MKKADKDKLKTSMQGKKGQKVKVTDWFSPKLKSKCRTQIDRKDTKA